MPRKKGARKKNLGSQYMDSLPQIKSGFCAQCSRLNLDDIFSRKDSLRTTEVMSFILSAETIAKRCSLCSLISTMVPLSVDIPQPTYTLMVFSSSSKQDPPERQQFKRFHQYPAKNLLALTHSEGGSLVEAPESAVLESCKNFLRIIRSIKSDSIDFSIVSGWLSICQDLHKKTCGVLSAFSDMDSCSYIEIPRLRLIDCNTRQIVPASNHHYITLSYMWGQDPEDNNIAKRLECLPKVVSQTIENALTVTLALGFNYLWVDRYCIDRSNTGDFQTQLKQMGLIYQKSVLTIVAAAGMGPRYGLPGVGNRHRTPQPLKQVGGHLLISSFFDPAQEVERSQWRTRGWTFQEGLLSRRRLAFTDEQVYYECQSMHCAEVIDSDIRSLHRDGTYNVRGSGISLWPSSLHLILNVSEVWECIAVYSGKTFSQQTDILKGILGIFGSLERSNKAFQHYWGIPIMPQHVIRNRMPTVSDFMFGLCWLPDHTTSRRDGFPSWSWTGWLDPVRWIFHEQETSYFTVHSDVEVSVELSDGSVLDWTAFQASYGTIDQELATSHCVYITGWTIPISIHSRSDISNRDTLPPLYYCVNAEVKGSPPLHFSATTHQQHALSSNPGLYTGFIMCQGCATRNNYPGPLLLIVCENEDRMERVGLAWFDNHLSDPIILEAGKINGSPPDLWGARLDYGKGEYAVASYKRQDANWKPRRQTIKLG